MTPLNTHSTQAGSAVKSREYFQTLSLGQTPRSYFGVSVAVHGVLLLVLILVPLLAPQTLHLNLRATMLAPPPEPSEIRQPEPIKLTPKLPPPPRPVVRQTEAIVEPVPLPPPPPAPKPVVRAPEVRTVEAIPKPEVPRLSASVAPARIDPKPVPSAPLPQPPVITNVFSTSAPVAAPVVTRNTETAGFGEVNAPREAARMGKVESVGSASFGDVNGSVERSSTRSRAGVPGGTGTSAGFDGGVVGGTGTRPLSNRAPVTMAGFVASADAPKPASNSQKEQDPGRIEKPVEVLLKPRPDYTDEARKMKIEGEVLVRVLFTASGEVRVLEVIRGLGYGLNENAVRAAGQIRFKPAQRAGQPVDSTAIVHISFQLAY